MKRVQLSRPLLGERRDEYVRGSPLRNSEEKKISGITPPSPPPLPLKGRGWGVGDSLQVSHGEKKKPSLDDLLRLADQLPVAERKTLLARLALQAQTTDSGQERDRDMWAQAVYDELARAFGRGDGAGQGPALVKRSVSNPTVWAPVAEFMAHSKLDQLTVTERQSVYGLVARLVVENALYVARKIGAPLSAKLVATCSANTASLFDNAFPGYLAAGLAPIVAKQLTSARP